jgi:hypothetical protein
LSFQQALSAAARRCGVDQFEELLEALHDREESLACAAGSRDFER